ncbi:MAG: hypothetical protein HOP15_01605 [Planctomycetes bacterium]|nr:hypothetical protein [Planctomycetota bacterium]
MRSPRSNRGAWRAGILLAAALLGVQRVVPRLSRAAPGLAGGPSEDAHRELTRTRREQTLIRAESTATMLRALNTAPMLPKGGP